MIYVDWGRIKNLFDYRGFAIVVCLLIGAVAALAGTHKPGFVTANTTPGVITVDWSDPGGNIGTYIMWWERVRDSGAQVRVDGECISACTILFGVIPPERVCVTERASFGFHLATDGMGRPLPDETERLIRLMYPKVVRDWIDERRPLTVDVLYMTGEELNGYFRNCT